MSPLLTIAISVLGSSAIFGFVQFLISRKDSRDEKLKDISDKIDKLSSDLSVLSGELKQSDKDLKEQIDMQEAINARIGILQASDEIRHRTKHSKEWFDQLSDDITHYEHFCDTHPDFKNNRAVQAIANINRVYAAALEQNDFL